MQVQQAALQAKQQKRRAVETMTSARRMRVAVQQARTIRSRDPNPRFALLRALRAVAALREEMRHARVKRQLSPMEGGFWHTFHGAATTQLMDLELPLGMR